MKSFTDVFPTPYGVIFECGKFVAEFPETNRDAYIQNKMLNAWMECAKTLNASEDGWISVDVHGIEWHCLVAVPRDNDEFYINAVSVGEEGDLFDMDGSYIGYHASQVSHWMPLPTCPKVK